MENNNKDEYVLGANVTKKARKGTAKETAVMSVRLTTNEVAHLESLSRSTGLSVAQIIRDAIASYEVKEPGVVMASWASRFETGWVEHVGFGTIVERDYDPVPTGDFTGIAPEEHTAA